MTDLLDIQELSAGYGEAVVLTGVSFSLAQGQTLARTRHFGDNM